MTDIEILESLKAYTSKPEVIDRAIEALEQEPIKDAVSRQMVNELVDELARAISDERCCISRVRSTATIMRDIRHLPSVTPAEDVTDTDVGEMPCEDAISRAELVRKLNTWDCNVNAIPNYVWKVIRELPFVTPAEKVGHWIIHIDDLFPAESTMECNKCHEHQPITIDDNYCPNCGSYNGGGDNGNE